MLNFIKTMSKGTFQGILTFIGFSTVTWGFIVDRISSETYLPMVGIMLGYFFHVATSKSGTK